MLCLQAMPFLSSIHFGLKELHPFSRRVVQPVELLEGLGISAVTLETWDVCSALWGPGPCLGCPGNQPRSRNTVCFVYVAFSESTQDPI